jgi:hypothetical protein
VVNIKSLYVTQEKLKINRKAQLACHWIRVRGSCCYRWQAKAMLQMLTNNCTAKDGAVEPKNDGCEWH